MSISKDGVFYYSREDLKSVDEARARVLLTTLQEQLASSSPSPPLSTSREKERKEVELPSSVAATTTATVEESGKEKNGNRS